jgi:glycine dehydrogenase
MSSTNFTQRHIGPTESDVVEMLKSIGLDSIDQLIDQTVPASIRNAKSWPFRTK